MKKSIILYGLILAALVIALKVAEYNYVIRFFSFEIYAGLLGLLFMAAGIWFGLKLQSKQTEKPSAQAPELVANDQLLDQLGITSREFEVLQLMAKGYSNQEIADQLFVSIHTIKTHSTNLYSKLDVKRRTQAVQEARRLGLIGESLNS